MNRLVCFGNSITASGALSRGWATQLRHALDARHPGEWEVRIHGVIGETSTQARPRFNAQVAAALPALVLLQFGLNDSNILPGTTCPRVSLPEFSDNLHHYIQSIRAGGGTPVLLAGHPVEDSGTFPQGNGRPLPENHVPYQDAIRETGRKMAARVIDVAAGFRAQSVRDFLLPDGVHLSPAGHAAYARVIADSGILPLTAE